MHQVEATGGRGISQPEIAILAFVGSENLGDEMVFQSVYDQVQSLAGAVSVISENPDQTRALLGEAPGVRITSSRSLQNTLATLSRCEVVVCGGGGIIQDQTSHFNIPYYLLRVAYAIRKGRRVVFYGVGAGPVSGALGRFMVRRIMNRAVAITVRDEKSRAVLVSCGVRDTLIRVAADPAMSLAEPSLEKTRALEREFGIDPSRPVLLVALRHWFDTYRLIPVSWVKRIGFRTPGDARRYRHMVTELAKALDELSMEFQVVLVPFWASRDAVVQEDVRRAMVRGGNVTSITRALVPDEIMALMSSARLVMGMRLHSLIAAVAMGVPHVAIDYSEKVTNFLVEVHGEAAGNYRVDPGCKAEELLAVVRHIQSNHGALEQAIETARERLQHREKYNAGALRLAAT